MSPSARTFTRILGNVPAEPAVQHHLDKAGAFQIQAALPGQSLDLQVVCLYYAALHWLDALRAQRQSNMRHQVVAAQDHTERKALYREYRIPQATLRTYNKLESLSRIARYEAHPGYTLVLGDEVMAQRHHTDIVQHVRQNLAVYGYVFPA